MLKYIFKRFLMMIPVLLGVTFIVFFILALTPGDPAKIILGDQATEQALIDLRSQLGLDKPMLVRYVNYVSNLVRGDMGITYKNRLSVADEIMSRVPNTFLLAGCAICISLLVGIPIGILSAIKRNTIIDNVAMVMALTGVSMPVFWFGLILVIVFALNLRLLPSQGMNTTNFVMLARSLVLPSIALSTGSIAMITRMTRSSMLEVIRQDYIDTARAKGVKEGIVIVKHMLKNALIPIITIVGLQFGSTLGGAIVVETVFSWPGLGRFLLEGIRMKDTPSVLGSVIFMSMLFSLMNLLVDVLYAVVDPRLRSQWSQKA